MKKGARYEEFIYERLKQLFGTSNVTLRDKILGLESGILREIDVSIRIPDAAMEVLYIVQCKDWKSKTDIKVLGEFSAVIQDVGASKGLLICSSGFAKTNRRYALTKGIELVTITDIESDSWTVSVTIP
ncbi:MAG: restriction endonuclease, partial [Chthonomonadales bacterium]